MSIPGSALPLLLASPAGAGGYTIERSLRFSSPDSAYLSRTPASSGNRRTWTWSGWVKRSQLGNYPVVFSAGATSGTTGYLQMSFETDTLQVYITSVATFTAQATFRDPSAWYHIVLAVDTTAATASDRLKVYVNGSAITFTSAPTITQNTDLQVNNTAIHQIGAGKNSGGTTSVFFDGYLADVNFVDGSALDPTSFGEFDATTGVWNPIEYTGSYPGNSFHLDFADNSSAAALGYDAAGSNDWTVNNLSVTAGAGNDSLRDSPTNGDTADDTGLGGELAGNYATLNPLDAYSNITLSQGNLRAAGTAAGFRSVKSTVAIPNSGQWYFECSTNDLNALQGVATAEESNSSYVGATSNGWGFQYGGYYNGGYTSGVSFSAGDILNFAVDRDNQKLWFGVNGTWVNSGNPATGANATFSNLPASSPLFGMFTVSASSTVTDVNFGQRAFAYSAPSGFKTLCTANLDTPTIEDPSTVMDVVTWTGDGTTPRSITGLNFSPDLVWTKNRTSSYWHNLYDTIRGTRTPLHSNTTNGDDTANDGLYGGVSSFDSNGFTLADGTFPGSENIWTNASGSGYVAWTWDAGTSNATNNSGSITSTVRANISAGFSIVSYTGTGANATVGHGLGVAPALIIVKDRDAAKNWIVYHASAAASPATGYLILNDAAAFATTSIVWDDTAPTSSVFSLGTSASTNASGEKHIAYCWTAVEGYSAFGSYTGNGLNDGPFVYTGFQPKFLLFKSATIAEQWNIRDAERNPYNPAGARLYPNLANEESTANNIDLLSNGFKVRGNSNQENASGATYIYAAFAESPFAYARAR